MLNLSKISTPVLQSVFSFSSVTTRGVSVVNIWHRRSFFNSACGQKFCKVDFHNSVRKVPGVTASRLYSNYHSLASSTPGMKTLFKESESSDLAAGITALCSGGVIAVPTDTIYGLAASAQNEAAVQKIYDIKRRIESKPLAICVGNIDQVYKWCEVTIDHTLLKALLPGPVTLVFKRKEALNPMLNPNTSLVGIRIPNYPFLQRLCNELDQPLALTSANISSCLSPVCIQEFEELWPHLSVVYDGGTLGENVTQRLGSTVVDLSTPGQFVILRNGSAYSPTKEILLQHNLTDAASRSS
ncbi:YRDC [Bugula neritina]|uniref:Threonylcarbamoyl-AMP synthase n=1 Tax=Bugula neritina TaxID=10212 RepID=A0A7J7IVN2_BUGNE|nr:YRDC [Bugula neritina]